MITRKRYGIEFQKKIAVELSTGQSTLSEVSKRERISVQTLYKWRDKYGFGDGIKRNESDTNEVKELKRLVSEYESALGEMALQNHILKKMQEFALARERRKSLSGVISPSMLGLKGVAR
jgi:transposase-like protein